MCSGTIRCGCKWFYDATNVGDTVAAPDQRPFSPLYPSYRSTFADLFGAAADRDRRAGRADRQVAQARRSEFHRAHQGCLRLRESARAAARDAGRRLAGRRFRRADRSRLAARRRSAKTVLLEKAPRAPPRAQSQPPAPRGSCATPTPRSWSRSTRRPAACWCSTTCGIRGGARRVDGVDGRDPARQRDVPRRRGAAGQAHRALHVRAVARAAWAEVCCAQAALAAR